jgi:hypothetical protein
VCAQQVSLCCVCVGHIFVVSLQQLALFCEYFTVGGLSVQHVPFCVCVCVCVSALCVCEYRDLNVCCVKNQSPVS